MRWYLRKTRDSVNILELPEQQEPRKSILRSREQRLQSNAESCSEYAASEASMVDLRSNVTGHQTPTVTKVNAHLTTNATVRSMEMGCRRNVLFLDEVQRNRRAGNSYTVFENSSPVTISVTPQPTLASYPTSYQPSPVLSRRDDESDEIELVSRSPIPSTRPDEESAVWVGSPIKQVFRNLSISKRKRASRRRSVEYQPPPIENGCLHEICMINGSNNFPNIVQMVPGKYRGNDTGSSFLTNSTANISRSNVNFKTIEPPVQTSTVVRLPIYPRMAETRIPYRTKDDSSNSNAVVERSHSTNAFQSIPDGNNDTTSTDSTETLRYRNPPWYDAQSNRSSHGVMKQSADAEIVGVRSRFMTSSVVHSSGILDSNNSPISDGQETKRHNTPRVRIVYLTESHSARKDITNPNRIT